MDGWGEVCGVIPSHDIPARFERAGVLLSEIFRMIRAAGYT